MSPLGDDEGDPLPSTYDGGILRSTERVAACNTTGRRAGEQIAPGDLLVALDGGVVVDGPFIIFEDFCGVLDANTQTDSPRWSVSLR